MRQNDGFFKLFLFFALAFLVLIFTTLGASAGKSSEPTVSAKAAALYEPSSGRFLYTKNENERLEMASTTKIMTALVASERLDPEERVTIPDIAIGTEGSSAYFKEGEELSVKELLLALMLRSANDASVALAVHTSGSTEDFALLMNERAKSLGLTDTNFKNPHGLPDEDHYTTAHDLAVISAAALENPLIRQIVATPKATVQSSVAERVFLNHNKLLYLYDGCVGVKTGFTKAAGRCLVGAAERDGVRLISVTLNAPNDWSDHQRLLDFGFSITENRMIARSGDDFNYSLPVLGSDTSRVAVKLRGDVSAVLLKTDTSLTSEVILDRFIVAPKNIGDQVGEVIFKLDGVEIAREKLVLSESAPLVKKKGFFAKIKEFFIK